MIREPKISTDSHFVLLMTACIKPSQININNHAIYRNDPETRLSDYKTALQYWLNYPDERIKGIVFVENSMYDLKVLKRLVFEKNRYHRQVEFLQFEASNIPEGLHYGYSEIEMIDNAFRDSKLISKTTHVIKVTGRIYFPKLSKLINIVKEDHLIITDCRDYEIFRLKKKMILTTLFIVRKDFYMEHLYNVKQEMIRRNIGLIEWMFYKILYPLYCESSSNIILRFPINVEPVGFGAHWNIDYNSKKKKLIAMGRGISRVLLPNFWI